jgi:hypothetical protein
LTNSLSEYRKHSSGNARVTINGRDYLLGPRGTKASKREYDRLIAEYLATGRSSAPRFKAMRSVAVFKWKGELPNDDDDDPERLTTELSRPAVFDTDSAGRSCSARAALFLYRRLLQKASGLHSTNTA